MMGARVAALEWNSIPVVISDHPVIL